MNNKTEDKKITLLHVALLIIAPVVVYAKVFNAGFMSWDDMDYVFNTADIHGYTWEHFQNWWSSFYLGNYQPLPVMTYALDYELGGQEPLIWHLQSIIWHIAATIMLYACIKRLQGNVWIALFVALLFAAHPVQTESVSWIAARNKVMYGLLFFWAIYIYIGYLTDNDKRKLIWIYLIAIAAYLCKISAITLPFTLFAVDIWMRRPFKGKTIWVEKIPLILLAVPIGIITLQAQEEVDFLSLHPEFTTIHTIVYAGYAYMQYLVNLFVPVKLSVLYPYPTSIGVVHIVYTVLAAAIVVLGIVAYRKKWYMLSGGIVFFTVNIAIVLQFVQFGEVLMADRYLYVACVGVWLPVVHYLYYFFTRPSTKYVPAIVSTLLIIVFLVSAYNRNDIWLSELSFWKSVIKKFPESSIAQSSLGGVFLNQGVNTEAQKHIDEAIRIDDKNYKAWYNRGALLLRKNKPKEALTALDKAISINEYPKALFTRALIYQQLGRCKFAIRDVDKVIRKESWNARAYYIKGDCKEQENNLKEAIYYYNKAIDYDASEPLFFMKRGIAAARLDNYKQAITDLSLAIELRNNYAEAWYWRGIVKSQIGEMPCHDLNQSRNLGFKLAEKALIELCNSY